ncbi:MAG TPA: helix-turn-helix transcriptional regulator, partial [Pseudonocardia sp.]
MLRAVLEAGLSQTEIAARVGISQAQVSRLAAGRTRDPGIRTIRALCDGLGIPPRFAGLAEDEGGEDTDRREFLTATVGVAASAVLAPSDDDHEQLVRITTQSYRTIEQTTPSAALVGAATGHLRLAQRLAERAHGP